MIPLTLPRRILTASIASLLSVYGTASAQQTWDGSDSIDWNTAANWNGNVVPSGVNAIVNTNTGNIATISQNFTVTPVDIFVGNAAGTTGRLDHTAGTASTGNQNWMFVGVSGGTGVYNLANTTATGGTLTGYGQGSGTMLVGNTGTGGRLYIGGRDNGGGGNGTVNVNTSGTLTIRNDLVVGASGGTGVMNVDSGTITTGGWNFFGANQGATGGNGTLRMSGGTLTNTGRTYVAQGGTTGKIELTGSGAYLNVNNEQFIVGENAGSNGQIIVNGANAELRSEGELWLGQGEGGNGSMTVSMGTVSVGNWLAVGRAGGTGVLTINGTGLVQKTDTDGSLEITNANSTTASGTVNLDGGILRVNNITGSGGAGSTALLYLNGGTLKPTVANADFIGGNVVPLVKNGGAVIDTDGFAITINKALAPDGNSTGGLTKKGNGTLTLTGSNTFTGATTVTGGELRLSGFGDLNLSSGATINGANAKLVQNSSTPMVAPVTLVSGTLDGIGALGSVTVSDGTGAIITHGDGTGVSLTIDSLTFNGAATLNLTPTLQSASILTQVLKTGVTNTNGKVTINVTSPVGGWTLGNYNLLSYSTLGGQGLAGFQKGTVPNLGARQNASLTTVAGNVALTISGDLPVWTGAQSGDWTTNTIGGNSNWRLLGGGTPTDFLAGDTVLFNDNDGVVATTINIASNVNPTTTTFENSSKNYTLTSSAGFGITSGNLAKKGSGSLTIANANTYAGGTTLTEGTLNLNNASAIGTGTLTINGGAIDNTSGSAITLSTNNAQIWSGDFMYNGTRDLNLGTGAVQLTGDRVITSNGNGDLTVGGVISGTGFGITKGGSGEMILAGANSYTGVTNVSGGTLTVTGAINALNTPNVGQVTVGSGFENATLRIAGGTVNATKTAAPSVIAGNSAGFAGIINVDGGTLTATSELWIGAPSSAFGQFNVSAGTVNVGSWLAVGRNGNGVINVNGGSLTVTGQNVTIGSFDNSSGEVNLTGGTMATTSTAANQGAFIVGEGGAGVLNVSGTAALNVSGALGVQLARGGNGSGIVNLKGGTITTPAVTKGTGSIGVFNFDGGTLRPTASNANFMTGLSGAYVYSGGANIDTNGQNITIAQALSAPTGNGIESINVIDQGSGYVTAPIVRIIGGTGTGATAVAKITDGKVTGITITNPGTGYTPNDMVYAVLEGGGAAIPASLDLAPENIKLKANTTTGGLNKQGAGTLTLSGENTYQGATTITGGTLALDATGSINGSSNIVINGTGAKLVQSNRTTPVTPTVNVTNGVLDGTGTLNNVVVGTSGLITHGNGGTGVLTIGSLTFNGGTVTINDGRSVGLAVTGTLTASGSNKITLNVPVGIPWVTGSTYDLISYGNFTGSISNFIAGTVAGLGARQTPTPVLHGNNVAITITGDTPVWTGAASGAWTTAAVGTPFNWKLQFAGTGTEFLTNDQVVFDDNATGTTDVTINGAAVTPVGVTFNNGTKSYTVSGSAGIASGFVLKNGTGSVSIGTANTYTGGTIVNAGALTLSGNNNFGTGRITVNGGTATLSGNNTYTGATTVNAGGTLNINSAGALGGSVLTINGGTIGNTSGAAVTLANATAQTWNGDFTFSGPNNLSFNNGALRLGGAAGQRTVNVTAGTLSTGIISTDAGVGLTKTGAGTLAMTSTDNASALSGLLDVQAGTLQLYGDLRANGGLSGAGTIENGGPGSKWFFVTSPGDTTYSGTIRDNPNNAAVRLGLEKYGPGTLNLTGANNITTDRFAIAEGAIRITGAYTTGYGTGGNQVASVGMVANQTGKLIIDGGTFNANRTGGASMSVGTVANAQGVLKMSTGVINAAAELWVGSSANAYGALVMSGGTINSGSWLPVGRNGNGVAEISGGTINVNSQNFTMGSFGGANGVANLSAGSINVLSTATDQGGFLVAEAGNAVLNVSGTGQLNISGSRGLHFATNGGTGIANLNGGTVTTPRVQKGNGTGTLNFDGGTLKASASSTTFMEGLTAAYVNDGGAVIDDGGFNITVAQPLLAPTGGGVSNITFAPGSGYAAAPIVQITGDGTGATAVANVDENGNLTGITITNPGIGYTFANTALIGGGGNGFVDPAEIAPNKSGGFKKKGSGTLTLSGANTYTGATVIESGTLALTGSISGSTAIDAKIGAIFDVSGVVGGFSLANGQTLTGSGKVVGNVIMAGSSKLAAGDNIGTLTINGNLDLTLAVTPASSAALLFELGALGNSDQIAFESGSLTIGSGVLGFDDFAFTLAGGITSGTYTLFNGTSAITGTLDIAKLSGSLGAGFTGTLGLADNGNDLVLTVVPEPGSATMLILGAGSLLGMRRFRRRSN